MSLRTDTLQFDSVTSDPSSPATGEVWFNTTEGVLKVQTATGVLILVFPGYGSPVAIVAGGSNTDGVGTTTARADHQHALATGTPVAVGTANAAGSAATVARADHVHSVPFSAVTAALAAASSNVGFNNVRLTTVADPVASDDVATKSYADSVAQGLDTKASVRLGAVVPLPANTGAGSGATRTLTGTGNGALVVDGVTVVLGDRILVAGETTGNNNGIYTVTTVGTAGSPYVLTRASDANSSTKVTPGMYTFVEAGTLSGSGYVLTSTSVILETTALTFVQFSGAGQVIAGAGIAKSGNTLSIGAGDGSVTINADSIQVGVISDTNHGTRGGGTLHALAVAAGADGFMSGADKTKLDGMSSAPGRAMLTWGNTDIGITTTTRYMTPGYLGAMATSTAIQLRAAYAGTLKNLRVHSNAVGSGASNLTFTVRKNSTTQSLACTFSNTTADGSDTSNTVAVAAGDLLDIAITKSVAIASSPTDVLVTVELAT